MLFVCTGNICRSAAADRLISAWVGQLGQSIQVRSAGTRARPGRLMHPFTERALERHGVGPDGFTSRRLSANDVDWAELILTMTQDHREEVVAVNPRGLRKVFTLAEAAAICESLPVGRLDVVAPEGKAALLVDALGEARSVSARGRRGSYDILDPIDSSARVHATVVDEIARFLEAIMTALAVGPATAPTMPIYERPPVPRPARRPGTVDRRES